MTPDQKNQIKSWSEQRDSLLREIGVLTTERDGLSASNIAGAVAFTDVEKRIEEARGRLSVLCELEELKRNSVSSEIVSLIEQKSKLEVEIRNKETELITVSNSIIAAKDNFAFLDQAQERLMVSANGLMEVIVVASRAGVDHISEMKREAAGLQGSVGVLIETGNKSIEGMKFVLEKLPRYIFELQKPIPVRRIPNREPISPNAETK